MKKLMLKGSLVFLLSIVTATTASAQTWTVRELTDKFTDKPYVIATNDGDAIGAANAFKVSFECRGKSDFIFTVDTFREVAEKTEPFKIQYRADRKRANKIWMRAFTNSNTGGMNTVDAIEVVNDFLNADRMVIRAITAERDQYDAEIPLRGARSAILKAVNACGLGVER